MNWSPDAGETLQIRTRISFASGFAPSVQGLRSFRDPQRSDIQGQLPGWPEGRLFELRSPGDQKTGKILGGIIRAVPIVANLVAEAGSPGTGSPYRIPESAGKPEEPENEVEDFPVIWAAPGTTARTLPWQLDPARVSRDLDTEIAVTDSRLLFLGGAKDQAVPATVLWQTPRSSALSARRMEFSDGHADVKVTFRDGSWTRLTVVSSEVAGKLAQFVRGDARLLHGSELTDGQRERVRNWTKGLPGKAQEPTFTLMAGGAAVLMEAKVPKGKRGLSDVYLAYMGPHGERITLQPDDLK